MTSITNPAISKNLFSTRYATGGSVGLGVRAAGVAASWVAHQINEIVSDYPNITLGMLSVSLLSAAVFFKNSIKRTQ